MSTEPLTGGALELEHHEGPDQSNDNATPARPSPSSLNAAGSSVDHLTNASVAMAHSQASPSLQRVAGPIPL